MNAKVSKLDQTLADLALRDYSLGLQARVMEAQFLVEQSQQETRALTDRLQAEMTRAFNAETRADKLEAELRLLKTSTTWRLGSALMAPVRLVRRFGKL